jgi:hypothetical protein
MPSRGTTLSRRPVFTFNRAMTHPSVFAIAISEGQALQIENRLTQAGFSADDISALIPDKDSVHPFERGVHPQPPDGFATGGVLGGALDLLASIGALAIPGVGRLIAAGPLLATLNGIAAGAAVVGIAGALVGIGIPEGAATRYENRIAGGNILITVHAKSAIQVKRAKDILESAKAEDIAVIPGTDG